MDFIKRDPDHHFTAYSSILHKCGVSLQMALQQRRGYILSTKIEETVVGKSHLIGVQKYNGQLVNNKLTDSQ